MRLVLAHGILGFGRDRFDFGINYFNGVRPIFERQGFDVFEPTVNPLGSLDERSEQLASKIAQHWPDNTDIYVLAHSMGGLDARRVIARYEVGKRIKKLVTIATPHFGSPVADAVLGKNSALLDFIPPKIRTALEKATGAVNDLTSRQELQDPSMSWADYYSIACIIKNRGFLRNSQLFALSQAIGNMSDQPNDGVVTRESALGGNTNNSIWQGCDHSDAIGWSTGWFGFALIKNLLKIPAPHIRRYQELAEQLANRPLDHGWGINR